MIKAVSKNSWSRKVAVAAFIGGLSLSGLEGVAQQKQVGEVADDFELVNVMTDEPVRLSDFEGSVVVLDFFSYW